MSKVTIHIYHGVGIDRKLIKTIYVSTVSDKKINGHRAAQIIRREIPEFKDYGAVTKTIEGWHASRAIKPSDKCSYHYTWEHVYLVEDEPDDF